MPVSGENNVLKAAQELDGFTSKLESRKASNKTNSQNRQSCDCDLNDEYVEGLLDDYYMIEIENWILKFDGCSETIHCLRKSDFSTVEVTLYSDQLKECNYSSSENFYQISFNDGLDQFYYLHDSLNGGNPEKCNDDAAQDQIHHIVATPYIRQEGVGNAVQFISTVIPDFTLRYDKGIINGTIRVIVYTDVAEKWAYKAKFEDSDWREKCGDNHFFGAQELTLDPFLATSWFGRTALVMKLHDDKRLKKGVGSVTVAIKAFNGSPIANVFSPQATISF